MYIVGIFLVTYHLHRFGIGFAPKVVLFVYLVGSALLLSLSVLTYNQVPWDVVFDYSMEGWTI